MNKLVYTSPLCLCWCQNAKELNQVLCQTFIFCYLWAVGGNLTGSHQEAFETFVREQVEKNNTKVIYVHSHPEKNIYRN